MSQKFKEIWTIILYLINVSRNLPKYSYMLAKNSIIKHNLKYLEIIKII